MSAVVIIIASVIILGIVLCRIGKGSNTQSDLYEYKVRLINQCLRDMDNASNKNDVIKSYNAIISYINQLPDTIILNNMTLKQARSVIRNEYEEAMKRTNKLERQHVSVKGIDVDVYDNGDIVGEYKSTVNGYDFNIPINTSIQQIKDKERKAKELEEETISKYGKGSIIDLGDGYVRVKWSYLHKRYFKGAVMGDLFWEYNGIDEYIDIKKSKLDAMEERRSAYMKQERSIHRIAMLNNKGIELEKRGEIQEAIKTYEQNISYEDCDATHSYDRLMILYRKQKDYVNELRIIKKAISTFPKEKKYAERLKKVEQLINKQL
ncbi:MAG: hypothetical protein ACLUH6_22285 [Bacteroides faecis]|jgi:tetratricopeptide (TPR) repeat protein|nr:MAG TPA: hypothetical protein [Caudoviricetes sp.]